jgi:hypothetical protein
MKVMSQLKDLGVVSKVIFNVRVQIVTFLSLIKQQAMKCMEK